MTCFLECSNCDGGRVYWGVAGEFSSRCDDCNGSGAIEAEAEPRTLFDMDEEDVAGALPPPSMVDESARCGHCENGVVYIEEWDSYASYCCTHCDGRGVQ